MALHGGLKKLQRLVPTFYADVKPSIIVREPERGIGDLSARLK